MLAVGCTFEVESLRWLDGADGGNVFAGWDQTDKTELKSRLVIDTWHCNINVIEKTKRGGFIANASLDFWIKKKTGV